MINPIKLRETREGQEVYEITYQELVALTRRAARAGSNDPQLERVNIDALIENKPVLGCEMHDGSWLDFYSDKPVPLYNIDHRNGDYTQDGAERDDEE